MIPRINEPTPSLLPPRRARQVNYLEFFLRTEGFTALVRQLHLISAEVDYEDKELSLADIGKVTGMMVHSGWLQMRSEGVFNSYNW